jgi:hypothetical protein
MDRRTTLKWMLAAASSLPLGHLVPAAAKSAQPYGSDPRLLDVHHPGDLWPLTFTPRERQCATVLCDIIIPADATSPSASAVGVVDFIDEWISAPYPQQQADRPVIRNGLVWFEAEAQRRFSRSMLKLDAAQLHAICDDICYVPKAKNAEAATFFARFRDLTAGGFYTTPKGRDDLRFVGNIPLRTFDGPPIEVLKKVGLA